MKTVHSLVIGAGSGGITAAVTAAGFGKSVIMVDKNLPGGECTWSGCVPSKALIHKGQESWTTRQLVADYVPDRKAAMDYVHQVRETVYQHESPEALKKMGIDFIQGEASFIDGNTVLVGDEKIRAKRIFIATGSSAFVPPIEGIKDIPFLTNESLFELDSLPESMIVLGGGPIGIELSQAMVRLGVKVDLVEMMDRIMPREEEELTSPLQDKLVEEGLGIHCGTKAVRAEKGEKGVVLHCQDPDKKEVVFTADAILVAVGRRANVDGLKLEAAGIDYSPKGIAVNRKMETSAKGVYAFGDVTGPWLFSHMANTQGIQAVQNALLPFSRKVSAQTPVWATFTEPELARSGLSEAEAREQYGNRVRIYKYDMNDLDRTRTAGRGIEQVKLVLDRKGRVLGATILADRAGEMIGEVQVIRSLKANFGKLAGIIHPYPSYGEVFQKIGKKVLVDNLLNHPLVKLFRKSS